MQKKGSWRKRQYKMFASNGNWTPNCRSGVKPFKLRGADATSMLTSFCVRTLEYQLKLTTHLKFYNHKYSFHSDIRAQAHIPAWACTPSLQLRSAFAFVFIINWGSNGLMLPTGIRNITRMFLAKSNGKPLTQIHLTCSCWLMQGYKLDNTNLIWNTNSVPKFLGKQVLMYMFHS